MSLQINNVYIGKGKSSFVGLLFAIGCCTVSCGKNSQFVTGAKAVLEDLNGEQWVGVSAALNTGLATMPTATIPIYDKTQQKVLMQVTLGSTGGASPKTLVGLTANLNRLDELPQCLGNANALPNGTSIPLVAPGTRIYCVPINNQTGRIYLAPKVETQELILGLALTIKEFQKIGQRNGTINLFLPFDRQQLSGVYGFFTGSQATQSGLGLFFDLSRLLAGNGTGLTTMKLQGKKLENTNNTERNLLKDLMNLQSQPKKLTIQ